MFSTLIATTSSEGLKPLGTAPQRSFELVTGALRDRLGEDHAAMLAEPEATANGMQLDWYAPGSGRVRRLAELDPDTQAKMREVLARQIAEIEAEAARLGESADANDLRLSEALANAVRYPDDGAVHAQEQPDGSLRPLLVGWAWVREDQAAGTGALTGTRVVRPPPPPPPPPPVVAVAPGNGGAGGRVLASGPVAGGWDGPLRWLILLGWLLLALLLAVILWLMIAPCGLRPGPDRCPAPVAEASQVAAESRVLEAQIAARERELARSAGACQPREPRAEIAPPTAPPATSPDPQVAEIDRRAEERGAQTGDLTFTLSWNTRDDIDLYVTCPGGETVNYIQMTACNGRLDIDANGPRNPKVDDPIENIFFNAPTPGSYRVQVRYVGGSRDVPFRSFALRVRQRGAEDRVFSGSVGPNSPSWDTTIDIR